MDNKEKLHMTMEYNEAQTVPLALHEMHMARSDRRLSTLCKCWAASVIAIVLAFVWLWNQYDYMSSETTTNEYSGVYNLVDAEGNVITSDISPEEVVRIMEAMNGTGEANEDENQNPK